jgi:AraC-like DNA-binding protein
MAILTYVPKAPLAPFVELFWYYDRCSHQHTKERILPTGDVQLIIKLREDVLRTYDTHDTKQSRTYRGPLVWGPHSEHSIIDATPQASCMGAILKPGGTLSFFGAPAGEFHGLKVPLCELWKNAAGELHDRLLEARTPNARFRVLEMSLLRQLRAAPECHPAVSYALREFQGVPQDRTIAEVTKHTGLCARWFIESFRTQVGLTPKLYCRMRRFRAALTIIGQQSQPDWADLACACGYFDQAHFIRDFRDFSGLSPTSYLENRTENQNHVRFAD